MGGAGVPEIDSVILNFSPGGMMVLNAILGIVMFSIALELQPRDFARLLKSPKTLLTGLASQFIVLPTLTFCLVLAVQPKPSIALGLMLVAACPGGNISNFITHRAGGNAALSVSMTACATGLAIFLTPVNIAFWGSLYAPTRDILRATAIDPVSVAITVGFMLVLPLALGLYLNVAKREVAARLRGPLQVLSVVIFIAFVVLALASNWALFVQYASAVAALVLVHNALAFGAGYSLAALAGLSPFDRRAVTIETGIQNSGLGLVLIFGFFDGLGGMAVVAAFWGMWHIIAGMTLAGVMSRRRLVPQS